MRHTLPLWLFFLLIVTGYGQQDAKPQQGPPKGDPAPRDRQTLQRYFPKGADAIANGEQIFALFDKKLPLKQGLYLPDEFQALVGKQIALVGGVASPGSSNDLMAREGIYIRIITTPPRDLRPHSAVWEVAVIGTIQGFIPANRIIVIEVAKKDWRIISKM